MYVNQSWKVIVQVTKVMMNKLSKIKNYILYNHEYRGDE